MEVNDFNKEKYQKVIGGCDNKSSTGYFWRMQAGAETSYKRCRKWGFGFVFTNIGIEYIEIGFYKNVPKRTDKKKKIERIGGGEKMLGVGIAVGFSATVLFELLFLMFMAVLLDKKGK